jgi:hypothetical protein
MAQPVSSSAWVAGPTMELDGSALPSAIEEGYVVFGLNVSAAPDNTGWGASISLPDGQIDLGPYVDAGGALEIWFKGGAGGEGLWVGFQDAVGASGRVETSAYGSVTTAWAPLSIPLADLVANTHGGQVDLSTSVSFIMQDWPADVMTLSMERVRVTAE